MKLFGKKKEPSAWSSRTKLLVGAAGLLLFIVGVKRSYRLEDAAGTVLNDARPGDPPDPDTATQTGGAAMADQG